MNPEKDKIASTQQNVESIVDKTQRVEISVTNVKKKENKLLSKTTINNISDGKFQMTESVWRPVKMNRNGIYSKSVGEVNAVGPIFRVCHTNEIKIDVCLFCYEKIAATEQTFKLCKRCGRRTLLDLPWMKDANFNKINLGSCVQINQEERGYGVITGINLKKNCEKITITMYNYMQASNNIKPKMIEIPKLDMNCLETLEIYHEKILPLLNFSICGNCNVFYKLGMGNLVYLQGRKLDTFQYSYVKLEEKLNVSISQLEIFKSKKQKDGILAAQENIRLIRRKMEELEPMLRSVTVQCPICGWNISENMV